jgi:hypothetical protein
VTIAADRIPLGQRSASELRAQAAAYRRLAATARLIETAAGLLKLADRLTALAEQREGHGDGPHPDFPVRHHDAAGGEAAACALVGRPSAAPRSAGRALSCARVRQGPIVSTTEDTWKNLL